MKTDKYRMYDSNTVRMVIDERYYYNTLVWSAIIKIVGVPQHNSKLEDNEKAVNTAIAKALTDNEYLRKITTEVNCRQVIAALTNYYDLEKTYVDTYLDITDTLNRLNSRDKHILLAYYATGYQVDEIVALFYNSLSPEQVRKILRESVERMVGMLQEEN